MHRFILLTLIAGSICGCSFGGLWESQRSAQGPNLKGDPPEIVRSFWRIAAARDEGALEQIAAEPPLAFSDPCPDSRERETADNEKTINGPDSTPKSELPVEKGQNHELGRVFAKHQDPSDSLYSVYVRAKLIYIDKSAPDIFTVESASTFNDQAVVKGSYFDTALSEKVVESYYLLRLGGSWRLFHIKDERYRSLRVPNPEWGISQHGCS